jgi:hypothetical protein
MGMKRVLATLLDRQLCDAPGVVDRVYPAAEVKTTDGYEATPEALLEQRVAKETQGARYRLVVAARANHRAGAFDSPPALRMAQL